MLESSGGIIQLAALLAAGRAAWTAFHYRPVPHIHEKAEPRQRSKYEELDLREEPLDLLAARSMTMFAGTVVAKTVLAGMNTIDIVEDERYYHWLDLIRNRPSNQPLITVANHESCADDPGLMGGFVPWDVAIHPKKMRWGVCTQEMCFNSKYPGIAPFLHAFSGAGQAFPIRRGGGIDQPLLWSIARLLAAGKWLHIFPEGRVIQGGESIGIDPLTTRTPSELAQKGRLKWGVGKLIAHTPVTPVVVPFHHKGMGNVLPQYNEWQEDSAGVRFYNNKVKFPPIPCIGKRIQIRFGKPIQVDDLISTFENEHGPLFKASPLPTESGGTVPAGWSSNDHQKALYCSITKRVEDALLQLEAENCEKITHHR